MMLEVDMAAADRAAKLLEGIPQGLEKATMFAINRAILAARTSAVKSIRETYMIKASDLKASMTMKKAGISHLRASLVTRGAPIDLQKFKVKISRDGVSAQVKRSGGGALPHSFFVTTGNMGIFHRTTSARTPLQREFGPSLPQMMGNEEVMAKVQARASAVLEERMLHEAEAVLGGYIT